MVPKKVMKSTKDEESEKQEEYRKNLMKLKETIEIGISTHPGNLASTLDDDTKAELNAYVETLKKIQDNITLALQKKNINEKDVKAIQDEYKKELANIALSISRAANENVKPLVAMNSQQNKDNESLSTILLTTRPNGSEQVKKYIEKLLEFIEQLNKNIEKVNESDINVFNKATQIGVQGYNNLGNKDKTSLKKEYDELKANTLAFTNSYNTAVEKQYQQSKQPKSRHRNKKSDRSRAKTKPMKQKLSEQINRSLEEARAISSGNDAIKSAELRNIRQGLYAIKAQATNIEKNLSGEDRKNKLLEVQNKFDQITAKISEIKAPKASAQANDRKIPDKTNVQVEPNARKPR